MVVQCGGRGGGGGESVEECLGVNGCGDGSCGGDGGGAGEIISVVILVEEVLLCLRSLDRFVFLLGVGKPCWNRPINERHSSLDHPVF